MKLCRKDQPLVRFFACVKKRWPAIRMGFVFFFSIQNGVFVFFFKKERKPVSLKNKKVFFKQNKKNQVNCFWKNTGFSQP